MLCRISARSNSKDLCAGCAEVSFSRWSWQSRTSVTNVAGHRYASFHQYLKLASPSKTSKRHPRRC